MKNSLSGEKEQKDKFRLDLRTESKEAGLGLKTRQDMLRWSAGVLLAVHSFDHH